MSNSSTGASDSAPAVDIKVLARLSRLAITPEEEARMQRDIPGILAFVAQVSHIEANPKAQEGLVKNVMREDVNPHESGKYTRDLIDAAPEHDTEYVKVPQVIKRK